MTLIEQASLVLIPSGYKEDTVYSVIPSNGSGDMSFTRASNGTRINSDGLVEVCPWNLYTYSEQLNNVAWTKLNATITANATTAPNDTLTADLLVCVGAAAGTNYVRQSVTISDNTHTLSFYAKENASAIVKIAEAAITGQQLDYNLSTNTITGSGSQISGTITNDVNGWKKITFTYIYTTGQTNCIFNINSLSCFIWGVQLNTGSTAKPYFPTTDRLNVPRLTYQNGGGGCPSLLLEPQRTNLLTYSNTFSNAAWFKNSCTISVNSIISPDGTQNGSKLVEGTANDSHHIYQNVISSGQNTFTFYAKQGERKFVYAYAEGAGQGKCFDLENGTVGANIIASPTSSSITPAGNGWYRCSITITIVVATALRIGTCSADGTFSYLGNGTSGIYIYGAQVEVGSYATSYIPTTSSSATRIADACFKTGISSLIGQTEGVIFIDFEIQTTNQDMVVMNIYNGTTPANGIYFYLTLSNVLQAYVDNSGTQVNIASGVLAEGRYKAALVYKVNDFAFYLNGTQIGTDVSGTVPTCNALRLENYANTPIYLKKTQVHQAVLFPTRLTNAELVTLTTI